MLYVLQEYANHGQDIKDLFLVSNYLLCHVSQKNKCFDFFTRISCKKREKCVVVMNHHVLFFQVEKFSFIIEKSANQAKNLYSRPFIRVGGTGGN